MTVTHAAVPLYLYMFASVFGCVCLRVCVPGNAFIVFIVVFLFEFIFRSFIQAKMNKQMYEKLTKRANNHFYIQIKLAKNYKIIVNPISTLNQLIYNINKVFFSLSNF